MTGKTKGSLEGERVLLIAPHFFSYESLIQTAIRSEGGETVYLDERPGNDFLTKGLIRSNAAILRGRIRSYYKRKLDELQESGSFTKVLVISPEALDGFIVEDMHRRFPDAEFVLYMWDSIRNKTGSRNEQLLPLFDRRLSFDRDDCERFTGLRFRPLFFAPEYEEIPDFNDGAEFDISFVGSIHSDRYRICKAIKNQAADLGLNTFFYLYLSDRKLFWLYKATNRHMRGSRLDEFFYEPLPVTATSDVLARSKCILDIQHPRQMGLTMRAIEVIGARRKLMTTNSAIARYDFYDPVNVLHIDRVDCDFSSDFITGPYRQPASAITESYSIRGWLKEVLPPVVD